MATPKTLLPASERTARDRDALLFVGNNVLRDASAVIWTRDDDAFGTDDTRPALPPGLATDLAGAPQTAPALGVTTDTWTLVWTLNGGYDEAHQADLAAVFNHNIGDLADGISEPVTVDLDLDDLGDFSTAQNVARWIVPPNMGNLRLVKEDLAATVAGEGYRFSSILFARLRITATSNFTTEPRIGEVWLGRRHQMPHRAQRPLDLHGTRRKASAEHYPGGQLQGVAEYSGQATLPLSWLLRSDGALHGADQLRAWWRSSNRGRTSVVIPQPKSMLARAMLMRSVGDDLLLPERSYQVSEGSVLLDEQPPFWERELETRPAADAVFGPYSDWIIGWGCETCLPENPRRWVPTVGAGLEPTDDDSATLNLSTSGLSELGIGRQRVSKSVGIGTDGFRGTLANFPASGDVHLRAVFYPNGDSLNYIWAYQPSAVIGLVLRIVSTTINVQWKDASSVYTFTASGLVDADWNSLDLVILRGGGGGGNDAARMFLNGVDHTPADHSANVTVGASGSMGLGSLYSGSGPMNGRWVGLGLRSGTIDLETHQAHVALQGI